MVRDRSFYSNIIRISLPAALQSLISFLVVVADNVMVSYIGDGIAAQAAVSQVNSLTAFYTAAMLGLISGSSVLISQYWGKGQTEPIKRIFSFVLALCFGVSLVFLFVARCFCEQTVGLVVGAENTETAKLAAEYFSVVCFSYVPFAVSYSLTGMLRSVEVVRVTAYISVVALFVNITLNYLFIFGATGLPAMGVKGAALATVVTRLIELAIVVYYTFRVQKKLPVRLRDMFRTDRRLAADYMRYGFPVGLADAQWAFIGLLKAAIIGRMSDVFMSANSVASSMAQLGTLFTFALAGGACTMVGKAVGSGDRELAKKYSVTIQVMFACIGLFTAAVVWLLRAPFVSLYGSASDVTVAKLAKSLITVLALTLPLTCYHASCFVGINRGAGDSRFVAVVDMICGWLVVLPATYLAAFVFDASLPVVFLCTRLDQCFKWIIAFFRLRGDKWIRNVTRDEIKVKTT